MSPAGEILCFRPHYPAAVLAAAFAAAATLAVLSYVRMYRKVGWPARSALVALRLLSVATLAFCAAGLASRRTERIVELPPAMIALDVSRSMNLSAAPSGAQASSEAKAPAPSRREAALAALAGCGDALKRLEARSSLRRATFSDHLADGELNSPAEGASTDLAEAISRGLRELTSLSAGLVLISDGRDTAGDDVLRRAADCAAAGVPIFAVGVGSERAPEDFTDLRVDGMSCPEKAFLRCPVTISADLAAVLPPPERRLRVGLFIDGKKAGEGLDVLRRSGATSEKVSFEYLPDHLGVITAEIRAEPVEGERDTANNVQRRFFRVYGSRLNVLLVEGSLKWEFKFLRQAVSTAPNVDLTTVALWRPAAAGARPGGAGVLPSTPAEWSALHCLVLGDVPVSRLGAGGAAAVAAFVERGGALLVVGGPPAACNYGGTPLEKVLPVSLSDGDATVRGPLDVRLTQEGGTHPAARVASSDEESRRLWNELPELSSVFGVASVKPLGSVLLTAGARSPLFVVQDYGQGRSAVFLSDESWKWAFAEKSRADLHRRFWRQVVAYLARNEYGDRGRRVLVETDRMRYLPGDHARLEVWVSPPPEDEPGKADASRAVAVVKLPGGGASEIDLGAGGGQHSVQLPLTTVGDYRIEAKLLGPAGETVASDQTALSVEEPDLEGANPSANLALLAEMARTSGGEYFPVERLRDALAALESRCEPRVKSVESFREVWNSPWAAAAFLAFLSAEWALRKRKGLS